MSVCRPEWLGEMWAKSPPPGEVAGETLAEHTWHVLERLAELIRLRPWLPTYLEYPNLWPALFWGSFLHDFGKAASGFQAQLRNQGKWPHRHEVLSLAFLSWLEGSLDGTALRWAASTIVSHHRDADEILRLYFSVDDEEDDPVRHCVSSIDAVAFRGLQRWLSECSGAWISALGLQEVVPPLSSPPPSSTEYREFLRTGSQLIRTYLRQYSKLVRYFQRLGAVNQEVKTAICLRGLMNQADYTASAHVFSIKRLPKLSIEQVANRARTDLYPHQQVAARTRGAAVLSAPTGSGKTEAALLWALQQEPPRVFYTLPYQASMNAMHARLKRILPECVTLEHSRNTLALFRYFLDQDYTPENAARSARWGRILARLDCYPVRVLSPYQLLKAAYQLKGYEMLLTDCTGSAFILDEVHAYDPPRLALILGLVKFLREAFKGSFFLMSATLPSILRTHLRDALNDYTCISATPETFKSFRRHELHLLDSEVLAEENLAKVTSRALTGASILVCVNTVARAQQVYGLLKESLAGTGVELVLLHGRFNGEDRLKKEQVVQRASGSQSGARHPIVLVATQVVEVSLDIDLDEIYTDPAPLEALLQRFGRINRRRKKESAPVYVFREPSDGEHVYAPELVEAALRVLEKHTGNMIDEALVSLWLDEVYQGTIADKWNSRFLAAYEDTAAMLAALRPFQSNSALASEFYRAFDSVEVLPARYYDQYQELAADNPLTASQLLVPIRWGQYSRLVAQERAQEENGIKIVALDYNSEFGLQRSSGG